MKTVFVTGADGFIGSHLVEALVTSGSHVRALVQYNSFDSWGWLDTVPEQIKSSIEVIPGDIRDVSQMIAIAKGVDVIFNLAALISIPYSYQAPFAVVDTNLKGSINLLEAAKHHGVDRFVQTSTSEVYGTAQYVPMDEKHPLNAQSPYAASKIASDQMALAYQASFSVPVTIVRPFNTYGPRQSQRAIIPTVISQCLGGTGIVKVGATSPTRDFNHVIDTCSGFIAAAQGDANNCVGKTFNLGSNFEISIAELIEIVSEITGVNCEVQTDQQRLRPAGSEVERLFAETSTARKMLGWTPTFGGREGFQRGLSSTIDWFKDPQNLASYKVGQYSY